MVFQSKVEGICIAQFDSSMARGESTQWCHVQLQSTHNLHIDQCSKVSKQEKKPSGERMEEEADEIMKDEARDSLYTFS